MPSDNGNNKHDTGFGLYASLCQLLHHLDKFTCSHGFHLDDREKKERREKGQKKERKKDKEKYSVAIEHVAFTV